MTRDKAIIEFIQFLNDTDYTVPREAFDALGVSQESYDWWHRAAVSPRVELVVWMKRFFTEAEEIGRVKSPETHELDQGQALVLAKTGANDMTRKDYEHIADALAVAADLARMLDEYPSGAQLAQRGVLAAADQIAKACERDNPRFNRARFFAAAGLED